MNARCLAIAALSAMASCLFGQSSEHQRIGIEAIERHRIEGAIECAWRAEGPGWTVVPTASLEYSWAQKLSLEVSLPAELIYSGKAGNYWKRRWGDPCASVSYLWRGDRLRTQAELSYSYPLERREKSGAQKFSPTLSLALVRDPVILSIGLDGSFCLPREEGGYRVWAPFSGGLSLTYWELLNDRISYRVSLSPGISIGEKRLGLRDPLSLRSSIGLGVTVSWDERAWGVQGGWGGTAGSGSGAMSIRGSLRKEW